MPPTDHRSYVYRNYDGAAGLLYVGMISYAVRRAIAPWQSSALAARWTDITAEHRTSLRTAAVPTSPTSARRNVRAIAHGTRNEWADRSKAAQS